MNSETSSLSSISYSDCAALRPCFRMTDAQTPSAESGFRGVGRPALDEEETLRVRDGRLFSPGRSDRATTDGDGDAGGRYSLRDAALNPPPCGRGSVGAP